MFDCKNTLFTLFYIALSIAIIIGIVSFTLEDFDWHYHFNQIKSTIFNAIG
jgi:hypothetical protein